MSIMTQVAARLLLMPIWMVAFSMLVKGYVDTGEGFSAGVVASLAVLLQYLVFGVQQAKSLWIIRHARYLAASGLLIAVAVAFVPVLLGDPIMTHYPRPGSEVMHLGSLELITPMAFDVGVFLLVIGFCTAAIDLIANSSSRRTP
ncbi:MAG: MnhB domain-containing protein [Thermomicrobiales bacterium]